MQSRKSHPAAFPSMDTATLYVKSFFAVCIAKEGCFLNFHLLPQGLNANGKPQLWFS